MNPLGDTFPYAERELPVWAQQVRMLHRLAIVAVETIEHLRRTGMALDNSILRQLKQRAYVLEELAASLLRDHPESEPDRSILYRSAACLAADLGEIDLALELLDEAISYLTPLYMVDDIDHIRELVQKVQTDPMSYHFVVSKTSEVTGPGTLLE